MGIEAAGVLGIDIGDVDDFFDVYLHLYVFERLGLGHGIARGGEVLHDLTHVERAVELGLAVGEEEVEVEHVVGGVAVDGHFLSVWQTEAGDVAGDDSVVGLAFCRRELPLVEEHDAGLLGTIHLAEVEAVGHAADAALDAADVLGSAYVGLHVQHGGHRVGHFVEDKELGVGVELVVLMPIDEMELLLKHLGCYLEGIDRHTDVFGVGDVAHAFVPGAVASCGDFLGTCCRAVVTAEVLEVHRAELVVALVEDDELVEAGVELHGVRQHLVGDVAVGERVTVAVEHDGHTRRHDAEALHPIDIDAHCHLVLVIDFQRTSFALHAEECEEGDDECRRRALPQD